MLDDAGCKEQHSKAQRCHYSTLVHTCPSVFCAGCSIVLSLGTKTFLMMKDDLNKGICLTILMNAFCCWIGKWARGDGFFLVCLFSFFLLSFRSFAICKSTSRPPVCPGKNNQAFLEGGTAAELYQNEHLAQAYRGSLIRNRCVVYFKIPMCLWQQPRILAPKSDAEGC